MTNALPYPQAAARFSLKLLVFSSVLYGLSACSGHSYSEGGKTAGKQFEEQWKIEKIYYVGNDDGSKPTEQIGGEFAIRKSDDSAAFTFVPGKNFDPTSDAWVNLQLEYKPGSQANDPLELVAEQLCQNDDEAEDSDSNVVKAKIHFDFTILKSRDLESLTGTLALDQKDQRSQDKRVTIFHFNDATNEDRDSVDILIFACGDADCKSSKMIHGKKL